MAVNLNQQNPNNPQGQQQDQQAAGQQFKPRTTGFTNLQRVLGANKNNKLGQTIGQGVQNITNKTQGQTQTAQQNFAKDIGQSVEDIKSGTKVKENLSNLDFTKDPNEAANKIQEVGGDQYAATTANLRRGYQGPQGLQNESQLQNQAQQLGQTAQGLLTQGGRQAALQRFVNAGPNYTQGKQQLDTMLLGQNQQAITQARRNAAQTAAGTNEALQQATQQGRVTGQQYNTLGQDVNQQIQGLGQNLTGALDTRAQAKIQEAQTKVQGLKDAVRAGKLDQDQYDYMVNNILGGSTNTYNLTNDQLSGLFNANTDFNRSNVAQQNEIGSRDALARLAGLQSGDQLLDLDESKVGTAGDTLVKNQQGLSAYQDAAKAAQEAQNTFKMNALDPISKGNGLQVEDLRDPFSSGQTFNYDQSKQLNDIISAYRSGGLSAREATNQLTAAKLFTHGQLDRDDVLPLALGTRYVNPIMDKYNQVTKQYGIGNSLSRLLKDNKTFGVK